MNKILWPLLFILILTSCEEKNTIPSSSPMTNAKMEARMAGNWTITSITYSGLAPNPIDSNLQIPFDGVGRNIVGFYDFDTIPDSDTNELSFSMEFDAEITFTSGTSINVAVKEYGDGIWWPNMPENLIEGESYVYNNTQTDTVENVQWIIKENKPTKQVWVTTQEKHWDGFPLPVLIDMETTIEK